MELSGELDEEMLTGGCDAGAMTSVYGPVPFLGVNLRSEPGEGQSRLKRLWDDLQLDGQALTETVPEEDSTVTSSC